jgi:hypothetical protein
MICRLRIVLIVLLFLSHLNVQGDAQLAKVSVRIPSWTSTDGTTATLNGQKLNLTSTGNSTNGI